MGRDAVDLAVVVPVRNEERRLARCLAGLVEALPELPARARLLVVDNGSTDASAAIASGWRHRSARRGVPLEVVRCGQRGKGAAVRAGVLASSAAYVGFCDADLATDLTALPAALDLLAEGSNVVVGSRSHPASVVSARHSTVRQAGAWAFRRLVAQLVPGVGDTQCGFKFFDRVTARAAFAPLRTPGFAFDVEVLARARRNGARIAEIPVRWTDVPGSTFSAVRDGWTSFLAVAHIGCRLAAEDWAARALARSPQPQRGPDAQSGPLPVTLPLSFPAFRPAPALDPGNHG
jgi:dolichyl-phosphate beta-glucosyltransferase